MVESANPREVDLDLRPSDIQELGSADALAGFFARLGYNTDARTRQTPANLGMTAEGTARPIKRIELLADNDGELQVYLFEVSSVTVAHTRALTRAFRNLAGNFLLVLTASYRQLDFVLVDRLPPETGVGKSEMLQRYAAVRPRVITIDRRDPGRVQLRVLRRFTYTESDAYAQYDKLRAAFSLNDWSEEFFNNRALFADYYLKERLPATTAWAEDPKPIFKVLRGLYATATSRWAGKPEHEVRKGLLDPVLKALGFSPREGKGASSDSFEPDYRLCGADGKPLAVCMAYTWDRSLDGKDFQRDSQTPNENPGAAVVSVLARGDVPWALVTNGRLWRLYSAKTHSRATNYYEVDLEETLSHNGSPSSDPAEAFRYFWLLFRRQAFDTAEYEREGKTQREAFLDYLLAESEDYAKALGERLKNRVFEHVFPHFARGFIEYVSSKGKEPDLILVFQGTLTFLYRLLFLLYAEARDLVPVREIRGYYEKSVKKLKEEIAKQAGKIADEAPKNLKKHYGRDSYSLYDHLAELFSAVDSGNAKLNVPVYNGGLFITQADKDDQSDEAGHARFLAEYKIPDQHLARGLDFLARDIDPKRQDLVMIDYKSLGVRQLGSIYEGLLEFKVQIAKEKLGVVREKNSDVYVAFRKLTEKQKAKVKKAGKVIKKGDVYLSNDKQERKASGSYYTPDYIVKYIVRNAVAPILEEKFEQVRPKLRKAEKAYREALKLTEAFKKKRMKANDPEKVAITYRQVVDELFDLRVLDPAMGSGHFLVEAVDYITDRMIDFLNGFPWNPVLKQLGDTRENILGSMEDQGINIDPARLTDLNLLKRHVLKRCIYGVDLNPMAVELAKVSLWLDCFTLGAPLSFLDHHLKCGNSLIGARVDEVTEALGSGTTLFETSEFSRVLLAVDLMRRVGELSDVTPDMVKESRREFRKATGALDPARRVMDVYASRWFGNEPKTVGKGKRKEVVDTALSFLNSQEGSTWIKDGRGKLSNKDKKIVDVAVKTAATNRFFHWEIEFPEVYFGPREGTTQIIEKKASPGFDAVVGNPPYDVLAEKELGRDLSQELSFYEGRPFYKPAIRGKKNLYKLFVCLGAGIVKSSGAFSFIVPMAILGDDQAAGVRRMLLERTGLLAIEAFPQKDDPHRRVFFDAKLSITIFATRGSPAGEKFSARTHPGRLIEESSPTVRLAASEVVAFDPENCAIPSCTQRDWDVVVRLVTNPHVRRMSEVAESFQGEVNETNERSKGNLSSNPKSPLALRGANICLYAVREASQGEDVRINVRKFLAKRRKDAKVHAHNHERVGFQRSSPQNNFRRLIASRVPKGSFCLDTVSYATEESSKVDLDFLLLLLNSRLLDWYFRVSSTNSKVNEYQFRALPVPEIADEPVCLDWESFASKGSWSKLAGHLVHACTTLGKMPSGVGEVLVEMCRKIQAIEKERVLKKRSERSHLAPESQAIQDAIDSVLCRCYGLSEEEAEYIRQRLKEML